MKQHDLNERDQNQKLAKEIYDNMLVPLQHVINDISSLGNSIFDNEKKNTDTNGNVIIPDHIPPMLEEHSNVLYAKLNMLILYLSPNEFESQMKVASALSSSVNRIVKSYNQRIWNEETTKSLIESRDVANNLYGCLVKDLRLLKKL